MEPFRLDLTSNLIYVYPTITGLAHFRYKGVCGRTLQHVPARFGTVCFRLEYKYISVPVDYGTIKEQNLPECTQCLCNIAKELKDVEKLGLSRQTDNA